MTLSNWKYLVTGASGFVGRNLYEYLLSLGADVIGTQYTKCGSLYPCDLTNYRNIYDALEGIDCVFMCATKTYGAGIMSTAPESLVRENIIMNANTLDACYKRKVKKVVFISSSVVYQESFKELKEEDLDLNQPPFDMYFGVGWVKRYTEKLCEFYQKLGMDITIVRPMNIYGKYDKYDSGAHFVPAIAKRLLDGQNPLKVWGTGLPIKNMIYVEDFVRDLVRVSDYSGVYNICDYNYYSISDLVEKIKRACGIECETVYDESMPDSVMYKKISREKLDKQFPMLHYTPIDVGLKKTVDWLKDDIARNA